MIQPINPLSGKAEFDRNVENIIIRINEEIVRRRGSIVFEMWGIGNNEEYEAAIKKFIDVGYDIKYTLWFSFYWRCDFKITKK